MAFTYASNIGAGTGLCGFSTLKAAYQVGQLRGQPLTAWQGFYGLTLGNAKALSLDNYAGQLEAGKKANFIIVDLKASTHLSRRVQRCSTLAERLFALMILGDEHAVHETWVVGNRHRPATQRDS